MSRDEIIKEAVAKKTDLLKSKGLDHGNCEGEQMDHRNFSQVLIAEPPTEISTKTEEDIEIGLALYMIGVHCPKETIKLGQFVVQLAKEESLPTFMLALINTLQSDQVTVFHKTLLGRIYKVLDDLFGFHLGKILLATSSPAQLSAFQNQYLPYLNNNSDQQVHECLSGHSCDNIFGHIQGMCILSETSSCLERRWHCLFKLSFFCSRSEYCWTQPSPASPDRQQRTSCSHPLLCLWRQHEDNGRAHQWS